MVTDIRTLNLLILFIFVRTITTEILYGGSIYWRPTGVKNEISFIYRLVWENGTFPHCQIFTYTQCWSMYLNKRNLTVSNAPLYRWQNYSWKCTSGCNDSQTVSNLTNLQYTDIAEFLDDGWETGVEIFNATFKDVDKLTELKIGFIDPNGNLVDGLGEAVLNLATRNDTKRSNISPAVNVFPVYRIPLGCNYRIRLFPFDGDGDYVHCHWYKHPDKTTRGVLLLEDQCEIEIKATTSNGYSPGSRFILSLYAEDHSRDPVELTKPHTSVTTGPFSRVPIKLTIHVADRLKDSNLCNKGPNFLEAGTLAPYFKQSYKLPFKNAQLPFKADKPDVTVLTTGPKGLIYYYESDNTSTKELGKFSVSEMYFKGIHLACGHAYTADGIPGESRCAVLLVEDIDECAGTNPCTAAPGGECNNLFEYHTCQYPDHYSVTSNTSYSKGFCDPVYKTKECDDDLGVKVGVPIGVSLLWLLILAFTVGYLKRYWLQKMTQSSKVKPDDGATSKIADMMPA